MLLTIIPTSHEKSFICRQPGSPPLVDGKLSPARVPRFTRPTVTGVARGLHLRRSLGKSESRSWKSELGFWRSTKDPAISLTSGLQPVGDFQRVYNFPCSEYDTIQNESS